MNSKCWTLQSLGLLHQTSLKMVETFEGKVKQCTNIQVKHCTYNHIYICTTRCDMCLIMLNQIISPYSCSNDHPGSPKLNHQQLPHSFHQTTRGHGSASSNPADAVVSLSRAGPAVGIDQQLWDFERNLIYNVRPPSDVCWFISPSNYSYKHYKP